MIRLHVTNTGVDLRILGHTIAAITDDRDTTQRTETTTELSDLVGFGKSVVTMFKQARKL
jgi:hypothetical protein